MNLAISCSLEGRDLAIVKSIININNIYGDLNLTYVDDISRSQVLIGKNQINDQVTYYAEELKLQKKYEIKPDLNPKTVRAMFEFLGNVMAVSSLEEDSLNSEVTSMHQYIMQHTENNKNDVLHIWHHDFSIKIDQKSQKVSANVELTDEFFHSISSNNISGIQYKYDTQHTENHDHEMNLLTFKWNLGYFQDQNLINNHYKANKHMFRLLSWPNFGSYRFDQEFIRLCSLLWKQAIDYQHLLTLSGYEERTIIKFLNATIMTGMVEAEKFQRKHETSREPKDNHFIHSLKRFFGFK